MKDGTVINLRDTEPKYKAQYKGLSNVVIYYDNNYAVKIIALKDISKLKIEIIGPDTGSTLLLVGGILVAVIILLAIALSQGGLNFGPH